MMSWFTSLFSSPTTALPSTPEKRILEESVRQPEPEPVVEASERSASDIAQTSRPNRNKVVFGAGAAFFVFSLVITRRAFVRKRFAGTPAFYAHFPEHQAEQAKKINGALEAMEALSLATINVFSFAMMATGGTMWYFNINSAAETKKAIRGGLGVAEKDSSEEEAEENLDELMAALLERKEAKRLSEVATRRTNERGQQR